jgi:hypothetical protein
MWGCGEEEEVAPDPVFAVVKGPYGFNLDLVSGTGEKKTMSGDWADLMGVSRRLNNCVSRIIRLYDEESKTSVRIFFTLPDGFSIEDKRYLVDFIPLQETAYLSEPVTEFTMDGGLETEWSTRGEIEAKVSNPNYALIGEIIDVEVVDENNIRWSVNGHFWLKELKNKQNQ